MYFFREDVITHELLCVPIFQIKEFTHTYLLPRLFITLTPEAQEHARFFSYSEHKELLSHFKNILNERKHIQVEHFFKTEYVHHEMYFELNHQFLHDSNMPFFRRTMEYMGTMINIIEPYFYLKEHHVIFQIRSYSLGHDFRELPTFRCQITDSGNTHEFVTLSSLQEHLLTKTYHKAKQKQIEKCISIWKQCNDVYQNWCDQVRKTYEPMLRNDVTSSVLLGDLVGKRVRMIRSTDVHAPIPIGTLGTIKNIDHLNTIHVSWDPFLLHGTIQSSKLGIVLGEDLFEIVL